MAHRFFFFTAGLFFSASCAPRVAEVAAPVAAEGLEPTSQTIFGQSLLLFLEHPHIVRGEQAGFLAHLSVIATGEPVRSGYVTLEIGTARLVAETPKRDGLFILKGSLSAAGTFPSRLVVESNQATETLNLGEIVVHPDPDAARAAASEAGETPKDAVPFLMEQQWRVKLLLAEARSMSLVERLTVPAQVVTPEGREAVVSSPSAGRLLSEPSGSLPRSGERVEPGRVLAVVEPLLDANELAQVRALRMDLDLKALDVVRAASEAEARLRFAEGARERIAKLFEKGLSTQQAIEQAEQDLAVARSADAAARAARESLEKVVQDGSALRLPLRSPIGGIVVAVRRVEGESLRAGDEAFRIVDTSRVWIEGRVSEFDLGRLGPAPDGVVTFAALPGRRVEVAGPYLRPSVDPESRTLLIRYEIENEEGIRSGMFAELAIATASVEAAVAIPKEAVVRDQGLPTAYVMLAGELFQKRDLELGIEDGDFVEVRRGLVSGERVATRGAYIVKLAALSPASFGVGHQH